MRLFKAILPKKQLCLLFGAILLINTNTILAAEPQKDSDLLESIRGQKIVLDYLEAKKNGANLDVSNYLFIERTMLDFYKKYADSQGDTDRSQERIIPKLNTYLEKFSSRDQQFIKNFMEKDGFCHGLSVLWLYCQWIDSQLIQQKYTSKWFKNTVDALVNWDGITILNKKTFEDFNDFAGLIGLFQEPETFAIQKRKAGKDLIRQNRIDETVKLSGVNTNGKTLQKRYQLVGKINLELLIDTLQQIIYDNELILISYFAEDSAHACALIKHNDTYFYYDPSSYSTEIKSNSIKEIANEILDQINFASGIYRYFDITVWSFEEKINDYPQHDKLSLETTLQDKFNMLMLSIKNNAIFMFENLIQQKDVDINDTDKNDMSPLLVAAQYGRVKMVERLLQFGADKNKLQHGKWSAKQWASLGSIRDRNLNRREAVVAVLENGEENSQSKKEL